MMRLALCLCALTLVGGCRDADNADYRLYTFKEPHMGTEFTFRIWAKQGQVEDLTLLSRRAFDRVAELNREFSDYLPESGINDFARAEAGRPVPISNDLYRIFERSLALSVETDGAFDITAGPLIRLWRRSRKDGRLPSADELTRAKQRTGQHLITLDPDERTATKHADGMLFDLGGIGKGYAADAALDIFREGGFPATLVAASGDIVVGDAPPGKPGWTIGIETLTLGTDLKALQKVTLVNRAISTSADTRRFLELDGVRYSHIVSPRTGLGLTDRIGASVVAPDATSSDSLATAVTILGQKDGLQFIENKREIECQIVALESGREVVIRSDGFPRFEETSPRFEETKALE